MFFSHTLYNNHFKSSQLHIIDLIWFQILGTCSVFQQVDMKIICLLLLGLIDKLFPYCDFKLNMSPFFRRVHRISKNNRNRGFTCRWSNIKLCFNLIFSSFCFSFITLYGSRTKPPPPCLWGITNSLPTTHCCLMICFSDFPLKFLCTSGFRGVYDLKL